MLNRPSRNRPSRNRSVARILLQVLRSADLRCPHCRRVGIFRRPYVVHERCPACGLVFQRDEGDFWGTIVFTYSYAGIAGLLAAALLFQLGVERWETVAYAAAGTAVAAALALFPIAKAQWIALLFHTRGHYEEYRPHEPAPPPGGPAAGAPPT